MHRNHNILGQKSSFPRVGRGNSRNLGVTLGVVPHGAGRSLPNGCAQWVDLRLGMREIGAIVPNSHPHNRERMRISVA